MAALLLFPSLMRPEAKKLAPKELRGRLMNIAYGIANRGKAMNIDRLKLAIMKMPKSRVIAIRGERLTEEMCSK